MNYIDRLAAEVREAIDPSLLPESDRLTELMRIYALLVLTAGEDTTRRDVHNAWALWMSGDDPDHESLKEFDQLDSDTRDEDEPFVRAIRAVASGRTEGS